MARSRKHAWLRDELILVLDLYRRLGTDPPMAERERVSRLLRALPIEQELAQQESFRSPNAVNLKLANFVSIDPSRSGKGMKGGGAGDRRIWDEFADDPRHLREIAAAIERNLSDGNRPADLGDPWIAEPLEGALLARVHQFRERNRGIVKAKKERVLKQTGRLACEACGFDFEKAYGVRGTGFAECHHRLPLSDLSVARVTKLSDLAIVCANCHRMIHSSVPWLTVEQVAVLVQS